MKTIILSVILLLICFVLLGVRVLFDKGAKFPTERHHHATTSSAIKKRESIKNQPK